MAYYHQVITQKKSKEFDFLEIEIYSDCVFIKGIKISMETAILLAQVIQKEH